MYTEILWHVQQNLNSVTGGVRPRHTNSGGGGGGGGGGDYDGTRTIVTCKFLRLRTVGSLISNTFPRATVLYIAFQGLPFSLIYF
jgi:hypothetical protein